MKRLAHQLDLDVSPEAVWDVLTDLEGWGAWNSLTARAPGGLEVGAPLHLGIRLGNGWVLPARARLIAVRPGRELRWKGGVPGLFRAVHGFDLLPRGSGCTLVHDEVFGGVLVRPILALLGPDHPDRYRQVNEALRDAVSSGP